MRKTVACLFLVLFWMPSLASDHGRFLEQREQGEIAPFEQILSAARTVVGHHAMLLDARFLVSRSEPVVRVFFHRQSDDSVLVVTVDATEAKVIGVTGNEPRAHNTKQSNTKAAKSRPKAGPQSTKQSGAKGKPGKNANENNDIGGRSQGHGGKGNGDTSGGGKGGSGKK